MAKKKRARLGQKKDFLVSDSKAKAMINQLTKSGMLVWLDCGAWGNRKKLPDELAEEWFGDHKDAVRATQDLLDRNEWNEVLRPMRRAQTRMRNPFGPIWTMRFFKDGIYCIKLEDTDKVDEFLTKSLEEMIDNFENKFVPQYPALKEKFKSEHKVIYDEGNYPTVEMLRSSLKFQWGFMVIAPPSGNGSLNIMSAERAKLETAKWQEKWKEAGEFGCCKIREAFAEIIIKLKDVLVDPDRKFKDSTVEKPKEFLAKMKDVPFWGDEPFEKLAKEAENLLDGVYGEDLRDDVEYRKVIGEAVTDMVKEFDNLPTVKMERQIDF